MNNPDEHHRLDALEQLAAVFSQDAQIEWETEEDEDNDDGEYVLAEEMDEDEEDEDEDEDADEFEDAAETIQVEVDITSPGDGAEGQGEEGTTRQSIMMTREQILRLLGHAGLRRIFASHGSFDDDDDDSPWSRRRRRRGPPPDFDKLQKESSERGKELMATGVFGANERTENSIKRKKKVAYRLMMRELGLGSYGRQKSESNLIAQDLIPSTPADMIIHYDDRCYSGQFSDDGNFFFSCAQDFKVRMYDTSNPYDWKYYKTVDYPYGQWTITDASLSPDNKFLAYSSIRQIVCLAPTDPANDSEPYLLDFSSLASGQSARRMRRGWGYNHFGIWSLRFSGDGREIVAGTGDSSVYVYDIERRQSILRIEGHDDDVNAVCFADKSSPHILYSGSDDTTLKVWDRRSMGDGRAAGVFLGHTEGLTYVDSKGDGRYILSNGKDQTMKLWDLRKVISTEVADKVDTNEHTTRFDYRQERFDIESWRPHPHDCSVVTFRGHKVLRTLIRCHFSPPGSTDSRYVYSGSQDGGVYVWNMDATLAKKIDVYKATKDSRPRDPQLMARTFDYMGRGGPWHTCVRDASWHPTAPVIAATSWNGYGTALGTCTVHSWSDNTNEDDDDEDRRGLRVDSELNRDEAFYREQQPPSAYRATRARRRRIADDDDDDEEEEEEDEDDD